MCKKGFIIFIFLTLFGLSLYAKDKLVVIFGEHNAKPYAFIQDGQLVRGIIKDIMDEVSRKLNIDVEYVLLPRKRHEEYLLLGKAHIRLISNPNWHKNPDRFDWSKPLFQENDKFVILKQNRSKIKYLKDLENRYLGTILGYYYPKLEPYFEKKKIIRDDVTSLENNFKKLYYKRISALIDSDILIYYHLKNIPKSNEYFVIEQPLSSHNIYAMLSKKLPFNKNILIKALEEMVKEKKFDKILKSYQ